MADVIDFTPIFNETLARIRARMDADANAGLSQDDPAWIDTREGSFYWDMTQVTALEIARLWDAIGSETVAAAFPSTAWGEYLDDHASTFGLTRNPAVEATGEVLFIASPNTLIAANVRVSADPSDPSLDAITFQTTASGVTANALLSPTNVHAVPSETGGSLAAGLHVYHVTAYNAYGETLGSADATATIIGNTGMIDVTWDAVTGALGYRVYRGAIAGQPGALIADLDTLSYVDEGVVTPTALEPSQNTTSGVLLPVSAVDAGSAGNLGPNAITNLNTLIPTVVAVSNPAATQGGADVEDDDALRFRVLAQYAGQGGGNQQDFVKWALAYPGVERAVCVPVWNGPQTVLVVPMRSDGSAVASNVVTGLQAALDPIAAQGAGQAPIGAIVTVDTTTPLDVLIAATVTFAPGYSLDGGAGTIATRAEIELQLQNYLLTLNPGDTIYFQQIQGAFFNVDGVRQVSGLTVNGGTADVVLGTDPPQAPIFQPPTLS